MNQERLSPPESVPLHIHTFYTLLNAASSPTEYVLQAKKFNYPAIGIADKENFYGLAEFVAACNKHNVKPIPGVELPLSLGLVGITTATLFAQDNDGLHDLFAWVSKVQKDRRLLEVNDIENKKGRVVAMVRGPLGTIQETLALDNFFYAIDGPLSSQIRDASAVEDMFPGKTVVAHDVRVASLEKGSFLQLVLTLSKQQNSPHILDQSRLSNQALQPSLGIEAMYKARFPGALALTVDIARDTFVSLPEAPKIRAKIVPEGINSERYLTCLVNTKLARREDAEKLLPRIDYELSIIKTLGFSDYILICYEIAQFCKERGIEFSVTGSGNNSLVLNILGVTQVEAGDLLFERFLNSARADLPDVDFDVPSDRKTEVLQFILSQYREASQLAVVKHLREKGIIRLAHQNKHPLTPAQVIKLSQAELPVIVATHPSGIIFMHNLPQERLGENVIAQYNKDDAEKILKLHKIDLLSNVGLTKIAWIKEYLRDEGIEVKEIPGEDKHTLARLFSGNTIGIANVESPHLRSLLNLAGSIIERPRTEHIAHVLALARPAISSQSSYFRSIDGKTSPQDKKVDGIIGRTGQTIIFQEQILRLATEIAGMTWEDADKLRKLTTEGITAPEINTLRERFVQGCSEYDIAQGEAKRLFLQIEQFRRYGFIEGHARSLAKTAYECAWLAEHFPVHFWTAVVNTAADSQGLYPLQAYVNEALRHGIKFHFPLLDQIEEYAKLRFGSIAIGKKLVEDQKNFGMKYSRFLQLLDEGVGERNLGRFIRSQLELFGTSFTHNPMYLIPHRYHFNPEKETAEIIGIPILISEREELNRVFITLDSGQIVDVTIPTVLWQQKGGNLDPNSLFWRLRVRTGNRRTEAIDILAPPVVELR
ncbi:MAG: PHP domain-containing protein [bacterium]